MRTFWIIAIVLLLWNLIGDAAFLMQFNADLDKIALTDPVQADAFRSMPTWTWAVYAIGVASGTVGAIALLLKRKLATVLFAISLACIVLQFGWTFLGYGLVAKKGATTVLFPLVITGIGLFSLLYARAKSVDGTLR
jgi:hypothetical protein